MITVLHGDNLVDSKNRLGELKKDAVEIISFPGDKLTVGDVKQALESESLFGTDRLIVIENLLSSKTSKIKEEILNYLSSNAFSPEIILWEGKELSPSVLKKFPQARISNFKPLTNIFRLVDSLKPEKGVELIRLFHDLIKTEAPEVIFVMLARQFRNLILAKERGDSYFSLFAPWQRGKLESQSKYFTLKNLLSYQRKLLDIDAKIKLGQTPFSLIQRLDIFLVNF